MDAYVLIMNKIDITVIIASYNPVWDKIKKTVMSVIRQRNVNCEIVITDDGSGNDYFNELESLFKENNFTGYVLVHADKNEGTCRNIYKGLMKTTGEYVKLISPGDYLYSDNSLADWLRITKDKNADLCFGDVICYRNTGKSVEITAVDRRPQNIGIYNNSKYKTKDIYLNYVFLDDAIFGSCFIVKTEILVSYLAEMMGFLKYAEDMTYRSMIVDGAKVVRYEKPVVWYEYGTGISTNKDSKWSRILEEEKKKTFEYIIKNNSEKGFRRLRLRVGLSVLKNKYLRLLKYLIYPELIMWKLRKNRTGAKTYMQADINDIKQL